MNRKGVMKVNSNFISPWCLGQRLFLLIFLLSIGGNSISQDFKKKYSRAKDIFNRGDYSAAMDAFNPLIVYDKNNPYPEYASFYYAISAHRIGFTSLAKAHFLHIRKTYPQWNQIGEVDIWLAKIYFDQADYFQAMAICRQIKSTLLADGTDSLKNYYLSKIDDVETLKMIREENPEDSVVDRALASAIGKNGFAGFDVELFTTIISKHNWTKEEFIFNKKRSVFKDKYSVAVLFPFSLSTLEPSPEKKRNQPILDLYQGMKLAVDSLNKVGVNIELLAYDTEHNPEITKSIFSHDELKSVDLIIGPLFTDDAGYVQAFSKANAINLLVNPVSNNSDFLVGNPYSILYQPSHETIGRRAAELIASKVRNKYSLVYFGSNPKDSVMAFNYMKRAIELGLTIVYAEEVRKETSADILVRLAKATKYDEWKNPLEFTMKKDSIGSIFVGSDDPVIYTKVINSVETRRDSVLIVGQESWLEDNSVDYLKFEKTRVIFASPNYCPSNNTGLVSLRNKYIEKHGLLPPENAKKGYEMMMNFGRALGRNGTYFQDQLLLDGVQEGVLTPGYLLQTSGDNGLVPFVSFISGVLTRVK